MFDTCIKRNIVLGLSLHLFIVWCICKQIRLEWRLVACHCVWSVLFLCVSRSTDRCASHVSFRQSMPGCQNLLELEDQFLKHWFGNDLPLCNGIIESFDIIDDIVNIFVKIIIVGELALYQQQLHISLLLFTNVSATESSSQHFAIWQIEIAF